MSATPIFDDGQVALYHGDCREILPELGPSGAGHLTNRRPYQRTGVHEDDPIEVDGRTLRFRYDVRWDTWPASWVAVEQVGELFDKPIRTARFISFHDFRRAYRDDPDVLVGD